MQDNRRSTLATAVLVVGFMFPSIPARADEVSENEDDSESSTPDLLERIEELEKQVEELKNESESRVEAEEMQTLLAAADEEIASGDEAEVQEGEVFQGGARALQGLNPEISVTGDLLGTLYLNKDFYVLEEVEQHEGHVHGGVQRSGLTVRLFEIAFQSNLDPFSFMKFILAMHEGSPEICEGYITWVGAIPRVALTLGKFHQQFGVINRWHEHALDQVDRPLIHTKYLGHHGLVGTGLGIKIMIPRAWAHAEELTIEVTNGENENLFAGEFFSIPTVLGHLKSYWDLNASTYLELGLSGVWGLNNRWGYIDDTLGQLINEGYRHTVLAGADLSLVWIPMGKEKYRGVAWRSEFLYLHKETEGDNGLEDIDALGGFTYLDVRVGPHVILGARFEAGQQPELHGNGWFWQASPYMTIWQSEFVYLRLQYNATWESGRHDPIHAVMLQTDLSAGPHKHEKY
jgi:hypothetical protein